MSTSYVYSGPNETGTFGAFTAQAVPEPTALLFAPVAAMLLLARRRK